MEEQADTVISAPKTAGIFNRLHENKESIIITLSLLSISLFTSLKIYHLISIFISFIWSIINVINSLQGNFKNQITTIYWTIFNLKNLVSIDQLKLLFHLFCKVVKLQCLSKLLIKITMFSCQKLKLFKNLLERTIKTDLSPFKFWMSSAV